MGIPSIKNRVGMTVTGTPGTGTITLNAAESGYQSFATAYGANANVDILIEDGTAWEIARDCTYTHSGTTVSRGTLEASSTGAAISLTSSAKVYVVDSAERQRRGVQGYLEHSTHDGTAAVTGVVGTLHVFTALTADRIFTLPASASTGDRVGVSFTAGSATYEILLKSATGDKINNVDCSSTEWSRLFIAGEFVIFRCIDGSTVDWLVEHDGRIPQNAKMRLSTSADGETANVYTRPTAATTAGAWTSEHDNATLCSTTDDRIYVRRAGAYCVAVSYAPLDALAVGDTANLEIRANATTVLGGPSTLGNTPAVTRINASLFYQLPAGEYFDYYYRTSAGGRGANGSLTWSCTFGVTELI